MSQANPGTQIDARTMEGYLKLIHQLTGITVKPDRGNMLVGRLRRRLRKVDISCYKEYLEYVRANPLEHEHFINEVTTNETYFFRTPRIWDFIHGEHLPAWFKENRGRTFNVWSAASSTGEEAHSLGVMLEDFKRSNLGFDYRIQGTDIDTTVIETARAGVYKGRSVERFRESRAPWFERYMSGDDEKGFSVLPEIKQRIQFSRFNLFSAPSDKTLFDLVLIRNVLIYFVAEDQEKVMNTVYRRSSDDGLVIIGESESLNQLSTPFDNVGPTIYKPQQQFARKSA